VIGVGVWLAVCIKGAKIEKSLFGGCVISTLRKRLGNVSRPSGRPTDEIWSTKCTLTKCTLVEVKKVSKNFRFWGLTPKPEVVFAIFLFDFVRPCQMSHTAKKRSLYRAQLTTRLKGGKICKIAILGGYVISTLPKLGEMLEALQFDLRTKFGPLSALKLKLRRGQKIFVLGADPQTGSSIRNFFRSIL